MNGRHTAQNRLLADGNSVARAMKAAAMDYLNTWRKN